MQIWAKMTIFEGLVFLTEDKLAQINTHFVIGLVHLMIEPKCYIEWTGPLSTKFSLVA